MALSCLDTTQPFTFVDEQVELPVVLGGAEIDLGQRLKRTMHEQAIAPFVHVAALANQLINLTGLRKTYRIVLLGIAPVSIVMERTERACRLSR